MFKIAIITTMILSGSLIASHWYLSNTIEPLKLSAASPTTTAIEISSFDDCVAAGYPVMESLPEQCATDDGRTFTNTDSPLPVENSIAVGEPYGESAPPSDDAAAIAAARSRAAQELGTNQESIDLVTITKEEWPDSCLGLPTEDEMCAMMMVAGYKITFAIDGQHATYRTDLDGTIVKRVLK